jgi:glutathione S-transferase
MRLYDYAASGNCYKARLALALLERSYERVAVDIFAGDTLTANYAAINPVRETPVLELDDGTYLVQSNAILWYLAEGTRLLPATHVERAQVLSWLMFEQESIISGIAAPRFWLMTGRGEPSLIAARQERGRNTLARLNEHLHGRDFLAGSFSIADIAVFAYTHVSAEAGISPDDYANVLRWIEEVAAQPLFVNDFVPYPANALPAVSRSIYD